jgi:hypothetical protein
MRPLSHLGVLAATVCKRFRRDFLASAADFVGHHGMFLRRLLPTRLLAIGAGAPARHIATDGP